MKSLLGIAKSFPATEYVTKLREGEIDLAIEYMNGHITATQVRRAFAKGRTNPNYLYRMTVAVRAGIQQGLIKPIERK